MRGQQLNRLLSNLRAELSRSTNISVGVDDAPILTQVLQRVQETLYDEHDWPHLRQTFPAITLNAGQRYYDPPDDLNFDRIESAAVRLNGLAVPFRRGIDIACYAVFDSDAGVRASPPQRWDVRWVDTKEQIEVWPIPSDSQSSMQFTGIRKLRKLVDPDDVTDLDDKMIVLFAAAELLAHSEAADAKIKLQVAQQILAKQKAHGTAGQSPIRIGMGPTPPRPWHATVAISGR